MKRVLLLVLRAQLIDVRDDEKTYSFWQNPSDRRTLPIRSIKFLSSLRGVEGLDQKAREYLKYTRLEQDVNICFCPAIEAIAAEPYQEKLKSLTNENNLYRYRLGVIHEQEAHWRSLSPWQRVWLALRCVPLTKLKPPETPSLCE